ncbi:hypothetical protein B8X00_09175 [Acetobacter fabarum]|uniref:Phage tail protein n=1 Tax=Acetobacter fabarum TaxID=483199 RepID=A0A269XX99_9PROT|nr:hypothetical protein B8X00_09175 [Acetobacter fabarum]
MPTDNIGEPGFFTGGSTTGQSPTRVRFWWLNMVQEELINIAQAAGIVFDKTKNDQCITAIKQLISGVASSAVMGTPEVLADGDVAGKLLYYAANQKAPVFVYGTTTVALVTTTALGTVLQGFLPLGGGNVTGAMDWGSKTAAATLTHRYWSAGPPAEGDVAPDATLTISGGTPGTANKGTMALSTGVFDLSASGQVLVPSIVSFDGKDALNALTADARYVRSVPATGGTNVRIVDVQEDAAGNLIATKSDGTTTSYAPGSYGTFTGGYWIQTGNIRQIWWSQKIHSGDTVPFPFAFAAPPKVYTQQTLYEDQAPYYQMGYSCLPNGSVTATNFIISTLVLYGSTGGNTAAPSGGVTMNFYAVGVVS